jgi:predicted transposase/invertase (TIGR01784 family)
MIPNPHDALFKAVIGKPEHARGVLRAVVPPALAAALDWQSLTLRPGSFVDLALKEQHTDLLYSATWQDGGELLAYFLFEHLSAPPKDGLMAYRLLRYQVRIWEDWLAAHPKAKSLPMIIPVVLYHGVTPWSEPRLFDALLDVPPGVRPAVAPYLIQFAYLLHDLSEISDDELREGAMTALAKLVAMCFKHARTRADLLEILERWMDVVREVVRAPNGLKALAQLLPSPGQRPRREGSADAAPRARDRTRSQGSHRDRRTATHRAGPPGGPPTLTGCAATPAAAAFRRRSGCSRQATRRGGLHGTDRDLDRARPVCSHARRAAGRLTIRTSAGGHGA